VSSPRRTARSSTPTSRTHSGRTQAPPAIELARYWTAADAARDGFPDVFRGALLQALDALGEKPTAVGDAANP